MNDISQPSELAKQWKENKRVAASGAMGIPEHDAVPTPIAAQVRKWSQWRAEHPIRGNEGAPPSRCVYVSKRPKQVTQSEWSSFVIKDVQEWYYVPLTVDRDAQNTQSLTGAPLNQPLAVVFLPSLLWRFLPCMT